MSATDHEAAEPQVIREIREHHAAGGGHSDHEDELIARWDALVGLLRQTEQRAEELEDARQDAMICGRDLGNVKLGCGKPITSIEELYRCAICDTAMHKECLVRHFNSQDDMPSSPSTVERIALAVARAERAEQALRQIVLAYEYDEDVQAYALAERARVALAAGAGEPSE